MDLSSRLKGDETVDKRIVVHKFGGTSLANPDRIRNAAKIVHSSSRAGDRPVVAASAMGDTTDDLLKLASQLASAPADRDLDLLLSTGEVVSCALLAIVLNGMGVPAQAVTGPGAGIITDGRYGRARIKAIDPANLLRLVDQGVIPVVAGFQGASPSGEVTTLGRGASDTTAVALAVALGADRCEINTDVDGIYSADPRVVPSARRLRHVTYQEALEMATLGAKVMHPRSVEVAERHNLRVVVRSSFNRNPGTEILSNERIEIERGASIRAVVLDTNVGRITVHGVPDRPGLARALFLPLAEEAINVDVIVQNLAREGTTDISFTVERTDLEKSAKIVRKVAADVGATAVTSSDKLGKVSIVGIGMQSSPGVAAKMFGALASRNINITSITTSEIRITCLIDEDRLKEAANVLHETFDLGV